MLLRRTGKHLSFGDTMDTKREGMRLMRVIVSALCLAFTVGVIADPGGNSTRRVPEAPHRYASGDEFDQTPSDSESDYEADIQRLITLRSRPLDELLALANELERKWRRPNWDHYAWVMRYVCSEISNRGLSDPRVREQRRQFARTALAYSNRYSWDHEAALVGALGYERPASDNLWVRERREATGFWFRAWRRLERERDPSYDPNDRKNNVSRVYPPVETGLPLGTPPSAIKDPKLRAKYQAAIAENNRKSQKATHQIPLIRGGPAFKARAEYVLIYMYSQPPFRTNELRQLLETNLPDAPARKRIIDAVEKNTK